MCKIQEISTAVHHSKTYHLRLKTVNNFYQRELIYFDDLDLNLRDFQWLIRQYRKKKNLAKFKDDDHYERSL